MNVKIVSLAAAALLGLLLAVPASAGTNFALLVGVSEYPSLDKRFWLRGPRNDVTLVRQFLLSNRTLWFQPDNILTLADQVENARPPTLDNIRKAVADLTSRVGPGDFVYLHFSGHGTQAPARETGAEPDGLDELFLPSDIGKWSDQAGEVKNALVDDEVGQLISGLRARGTDVWVVFDSCHSGTVTRNAPTTGPSEREVARQLPPTILGISTTMLDESELVVSATRSGPASQGQARDPPLEGLADGAGATGSLVAFFAAQTNETTPEMRLPAGKRGRKPHGLFTFTLFEVLATAPGLTYRQIGQEILRRYGTSYRVQPTPLFEGELNSGAFGAPVGRPIRQWPLTKGNEGYTIPAGALHGLSQDDRLMILRKPTDPNSAAVGQVRLSQVDILTSTVKPVGEQQADFPDAGYVRRGTSNVDFTLKVAEPASQTLSARLAGKSDAVLAALRADATDRMEFVPPSSEADVRLQVYQSGPSAGEAAQEAQPARLALVLGGDVNSGTGDRRSLSILLDDRPAGEIAEVLADTLARMARTINVMRLGEAYRRETSGLDIMLKGKSGTNRQFRPLDPAQVSRMAPGDEIHLQASNRDAGPIDLNVLFIGSDYSITFLYAGRIKPGETLNKGLLRINDSSFGRERVLLIGTPALPQTAVEDLRWLAQTALPKTRAARQRAGLSGLLAEAASG